MKKMDQNEIGRENFWLLPKHLGWWKVVANHCNGIEQGRKGGNDGTQPETSFRTSAKGKKKNGRQKVEKEFCANVPLGNSQIKIR